MVFKASQKFHGFFLRAIRWVFSAKSKDKYITLAATKMQCENSKTIASADGYFFKG
mgnify:CR=1 FL=1